MGALILLFSVLIFIAIAQWRGWTADSSGDMGWLPREEAQRRRIYSFADPPPRLVTGRLGRLLGR
jgi:hypothetical protein